MGQGSSRIQQSRAMQDQRPPLAERGHGPDSFLIRRPLEQDGYPVPSPHPVNDPGEQGRISALVTASASWVKRNQQAWIWDPLSSKSSLCVFKQRVRNAERLVRYVGRHHACEGLQHSVLLMDGATRRGERRLHNDAGRAKLLENGLKPAIGIPQPADGQLTPRQPFAHRAGHPPGAGHQPGQRISFERKRGVHLRTRAKHPPDLLPGNQAESVTVKLPPQRSNGWERQDHVT